MELAVSTMETEVTTAKAVGTKVQAEADLGLCPGILSPARQLQANSATGAATSSELEQEANEEAARRRAKRRAVLNANRANKRSKN